MSEKMEPTEKKEKKEKKASLRKAFKEFIWPRKNIIFVGLILIGISRTASLIIPWQTQVLIDDVVANKNYPGLKQLLLIVGLAIFFQAVT